MLALNTTTKTFNRLPSYWKIKNRKVGESEINLSEAA